MELYQILNVFGISFNIIGIFMLFKHGFPANDYLKNNGWIVKIDVTDDEILKYKKAQLYSKIAKILLLTGLILQLISISIFSPSCIPCNCHYY